MSLQFLLRQSFFGPTHSWREGFLEESFQLQLHLGMSYTEVRKLPVRYRRWYITRLLKHFKDKNEASQSKPKNNSSNMQALDKYKTMIDKKFK